MPDSQPKVDVIVVGVVYNIFPGGTTLFEDGTRPQWIEINEIHIQNRFFWNFHFSSHLKTFLIRRHPGVMIMSHIPLSLNLL